MRIDELAVPEFVPILPLRGSVLFPGGILPLFIGRPRMVALIREAHAQNRFIGVVTQRVAATEDPRQADLFSVGTLASVETVTPRPDGGLDVEVHGLARFSLLELFSSPQYLTGRIANLSELPHDEESGSEISRLRDSTLEFLALSADLPAIASETVVTIGKASHLADLIAANLTIPLEEKQLLLEDLNVGSRIRSTQHWVDRLLATLSAGGQPRLDSSAPRCGRHRRVSADTCKRCGIFICASCLSVENNQGQCSNCLARPIELDVLSRALRVSDAPSRLGRISAFLSVASVLCHLLFRGLFSPAFIYASMTVPTLIGLLLAIVALGARLSVKRTSTNPTVAFAVVAAVIATAFHFLAIRKLPL